MSVAVYSEGYAASDLKSGSSGERRYESLMRFISDNSQKRVIIIDDIELHLHLKVQKNLIDEIREKTSAQLFLATHSPGIVKKSWVDKVIDVKVASRTARKEVE